MKTCFKCDIQKELDKFYKDRTKTNNCSTYCKICSKDLEYKKRSNSQFLKIHRAKESLRRSTSSFKQQDKERRSSAIYKTKKQIYNKKWRSDPLNKLRCSMASSIRYHCSRSGRSFSTIFGFRIKELKEHMESKFELEMNWDNYGKGGWSVDHIIPVKYKINEKYYWDQEQLKNSNSQDFKKCWALSNLQPKWEIDNIKKGNRYIG